MKDFLRKVQKVFNRNNRNNDIREDSVPINQESQQSTYDFNSIADNTQSNVSANVPTQEPVQQVSNVQINQEQGAQRSETSWVGTVRGSDSPQRSSSTSDNNSPGRNSDNYLTDVSNSLNTSNTETSSEEQRRTPRVAPLTTDRVLRIGEREI